MKNSNEFKKEFDELLNNLNKCQIDNENEEYDDGDDFADYIAELKTKMLTVEKSGIYFSKTDIRNISLECGEKIAPQQRDRMITHLLKSIFSIDDMQKVFDTIKGHIDIKIAYYDELSQAFPKSSSFFNKHKQKAIKLKSSLDRILDESNGNIYKH